jgi:hypothetical protein
VGRFSDPFDFDHFGCIGGVFCLASIADGFQSPTFEHITHP